MMKRQRTTQDHSPPSSEVEDDFPLLSATDNTERSPLPKPPPTRTTNNAQHAAADDGAHDSLPTPKKHAHNGGHSATTKRGKNVHDRVHDVIELEPLLVAAMDTPEFQRLDAISQLGGASYAYPSATHTRKEHSIGVSHLAAVMVRHLQLTQPELDIDGDDLLCIRLAGLLHDVGHGPYSHMFETFLKRRGARTGDQRLLAWEHEEMSMQLVDLITARLGGSLCGYFSEGTTASRAAAHMAFTKLLIHGLAPSAPWPAGAIARPESKRFMCDIVSNARNGLDVDKLDYLLRDSMSCFGSANLPGLSVHRIITSSRVLNNEVCFEEKTALDIVEVYSLRARLHQSVYQHHTANVAEIMITDVLDEAADDVVFRGHDGKETTLLEAALHAPSFAMLTDGIFDVIRLSPSPRLARAQAIIDRLARRRFYYKASPEVKLATLPLCPSCALETQIGWQFCPRCAHSLKERRGVIKKSGGVCVLTARGREECLRRYGTRNVRELDEFQCGALDDVFKVHVCELSQSGSDYFERAIVAECARIGMPVDDEVVHVHIVDYQHGKRDTHRDHWGREWEVYDPFANVSFFNPKQTTEPPRRLDKRRVPSIRLPSEHHARTLYCYTRSDDAEIIHAVQTGYLSWTKKMKGVSEQSGTSNTPTPSSKRTSSVALAAKDRVRRDLALADADLRSDDEHEAGPGANGRTRHRGGSDGKAHVSSCSTVLEGSEVDEE